MFEPPALFALDLEPIIRIGVVLIFVLGPLLKGMFNAGGKAKPPQRNRLPQRPPQRPPQAGGAPGAGNPANQLENEIEEFLRRAAGGNPPAKNNPPVQNRPRREMFDAEVVQAEVVEAEVVDPRPRRLSDSRTNPKPKQTTRARTRSKPTRKTKRTQPKPRTLDPVGGHDDELGADIGREVDEMESHVHDVFDHKVGSLGESLHIADDIDDRGTDSEVWEGAAARRKRATEQRRRQSEAMKRMIRDPDSVHQAIIMAEILQRPDF